ncbi:multidrug ABC transporter permease [Bacillus methanolicus]|uniref:multidrug ABC transporter permease n=1 Tax=Bacillus methanolicus TaxID=1471 RepID=UPI00200EAE58|nr:multidrug ABC transporter permease [Bacillus methanolicus]UQD52131.1 multidrug ABC transporter permease [Bacillus methanolicus]
MQSKISWFNRELVFQIFRSVGWIGIVYFLSLFFALPLEILMKASNDEFLKYAKVNNLFEFNYDIQLIFMIVLPVLLSVFLFRFLQVKQAADLIHSLPLKREKIYHHYAVSGFILLLLPVVLNSVVLIIVQKVMGLEQLFGLKDISYWMGKTLLLNFVVYIAGIFVGMFTGISAVHGVLTYIFLLFPAGISVLLVYNLKYFLYGFPADYFLNMQIKKFSPLLLMIDLNYKPLDARTVFVLMAIIILLYWLSLFVYKKRKLEAASQAIAFRKLVPIFKYGTTACFMMLGGLYFGMMQHKFGWILFGYAAGSIVGYFAAEMVLQKSWRVLVSIKGYFFYAAAAALIIAVFQFDFTNYEKTVPKLEDIECVHFSNSPYQFTEGHRSMFFLKDRKNLNAVRILHEQISKNRKWIDDNSMTEPIFIEYELKNGDKLIRQYDIQKGDYSAFLKPIIESEEYKLATNELLRIDENEADKLTIMPKGSVNKSAVITDPADLKEAIKILKEEVLQESYEDISSNREAFSDIEILLKNNKRIHAEWKTSYQHFEDWLRNKGLLENARIMPDEISHILVIKQKDFPNNSDMEVEDLFQKLERKGEALKITDKKQIEECLKNTSWNEGEYVAAFFYKNQNNIDIRNIYNKHVPHVIKEYFEK